MKHLVAHKIILSARSSFFKNISIKLGIFIDKCDIKKQSGSSKDYSIDSKFVSQKHFQKVRPLLRQM